MHDGSADGVFLSSKVLRYRILEAGSCPATMNAILL